MHRKVLNVLLLSMIIIMLLTPISIAQTDSLAVWENIAEGTLLADWTEVIDSEWKGQNDSGTWEYNCTTANESLSYNNTIIGDRWFNTWEVTSDDAETGICAAQVINSTDFYGVIYYLDGSDHGTGPECYIIYNDNGTMWFWNDTGFDIITNATDYSGQEEDYTSGFFRVKTLWNWNNDTGCNVRFKLWDPSGDEPVTWLVDEIITVFPGDTNTMYYSGLYVNASYTAAGSETDFRRIFYWNLSFDYDTTGHTIDEQIPYIGCPQYDAETLLDMIADNAGEDVWNYTQIFKTMINLWDLTSFYDLNDITKNGQNDTNYIFSIMTTGWEDLYEEYFEFEYPGEVFPNNILIFYIYETIDGTPTDGGITWDDFCYIRFDFNNDGYTADDYSFALSGNSGGTLFGYHGWTQVIPDSPGEWYGQGTITDQNDDAEWGNIFRDHEYPAYVFFLNWDLISDETDAGELVNISIGFYDNETTNFCLWQDWDEENDTIPLTPESDNVSFCLNNDTEFWGIFEILGGSLDFEDPFQWEPLTGRIVSIYPILIAVFLLVAIFSMAVTSTLSVKSLTIVLILSILAIVLIQIITSIG